jgi:hypothetical protein
MTLFLEAIVAALALPVVVTTGHGTDSVGFYLILALIVLLLVAAGVQRRPWGLAVALAAQGAMIACGLFSVALGALGVVFALVWGYFLWLGRDLRARLAVRDRADNAPR